MRILQIHNKYLQLGGEDTVVQNERSLLTQNGHEVMLCELDNKDLEGLSKTTLFARTVFNKHAYKKVVDCIDQFQPDLVHIHNVFYEASPSIFFALKQKNVPTVMTIHNYRFGCIQGLLFRDNLICRLCIDNKSAYYGIKHKCFQNSFAKSLQLTLVNALHSFALKHRNPVQQYIFLAIFTKELLTPTLAIKANNWSIKPNYVSDFGHTPFEHREDYYLFVGRLNEQKGVKQLIDIFTANQKKLIIIGTGPLEELVRQAAKKEKNIQYEGYSNNETIIHQLKKSKALIVPSLTYEGQPMTILEAFSTGTPVLAANTKNLDTLIESGKNGFLFNPLQTEQTCKIIEKFEHSATREIYENARKTYETLYSPQSNYNQLISIYQRAIQQRKARFGLWT